MRDQFIQTITDMFEKDEKCVLLLGDIGVYGFRHLTEKYPSRVINIGICEQATIGIAAGMAKEGLHPIFYTIAPFAVERCFEQIKIDIGYQNLPVSIVSVGASYDYSGLGCTHHCPADVALLKTIPGMLIFTPAYREDVDSLLKAYNGKEALYMRLPSSVSRIMDVPSEYERDVLVLAYGESIGPVVSACDGFNVDIRQGWLASKESPFYRHKAKTESKPKSKIIIIEPWYEGTMHYDVQQLYPEAKIYSIGVPRQFLTNYGTKKEHDQKYGLDVAGLKKRITEIINE